MGMRCWPLLCCQADDSEHIALQVAPALYDCSYHSHLTCFALSACVKYRPGPHGPAWLSPVSRRATELLPGAPLSPLPAAADASGNGGMPSACPGPGLAASSHAAPSAPTPPQDGRAGTLAAPTHCSWLLPWPGLVRLCAAAVGLLLPWGCSRCTGLAVQGLCQGECPTVGSWSLDFSGILGSLSHCAGGPTPPAPPCWLCPLLAGLRVQVELGWSGPRCQPVCHTTPCHHFSPHAAHRRLQREV